jgi:DNA-binding NarL/FixJ family response regulator
MESTPVVLVVDDDLSFRALARAVLEQGGYAVVEAADAAEALAAVREAPPAAVLLDVHLPGVSGYEVCRSLRDEHGDGLPVIFVSGARTESYDRVAGLTIGADDYIVKPFAPDELLARLRCVRRRHAPPGPAAAAGLSPREHDVLTLLAGGADQLEIAERLVLSESTVGKHIERILEKLGVHSRAQAVAAAYRQALVPLPEPGGGARRSEPLVSPHG